MSVKIPRQMGAMDGPKWSATTTATQYRAPPKPQSWGQETQGTSSTWVDLFTTEINIDHDCMTAEVTMLHSSLKTVCNCALCWTDGA